MSRAVGDVFELRAFFSLNVINIVTKTLQLVCAIGILFYLHWRLTLLSLAVLPLFVALTQMFGGRLRRLSRDALERNALVSQNLEETLSATGVIKAFGSEGRETDRVATTLEEAFAANYRRTTAGASYGLLSAAVNAVGIGGVLWYGASRILAHELTMGELLAFSAYLGLLIQPARFLAGLNVTMQQALAAMERVLALMKLIPEDERDETKRPVARLDGRVAFEHVTFSYGGAHQALRDVSFTAGPRELVAIVGPSGAGKTTLVSLILCLYQADSGRICFDGIPVDTLQRHSLRERIGLVSQETFLFDDTVATNIRYGRPDTSDDLVARAAREARADEFISALPDGYETRVGERGVKLSAGQKQRIAIARALLRDPDILILDEATSALDALTEHAFHTVLKDLGRRKTVFVVAHRLSTVLLSDSVLVLEEGRVVQRGTHEELWRQGGLYGHLCDTQLAASLPVRA
jgi:subfamily B ATP-binding cassette protein MsbA